MPTVDFYLLNSIETDLGLRFLCRLIEKAYQQKKTAYIYLTEQDKAEYLDNLLWTFRDISFVPHQLGQSKTSFDTAIVIDIAKPSHSYDILFNLTSSVPDFFTDFSRIIELVLEEKSQKQQGRKKYKHYKEYNCPLKTHTIATS